jgi:prepilin-type N-terminal cleavage/methylation domain-containing protein
MQILATGKNRIEAVGYPQPPARETQLATCRYGSSLSIRRLPCADSGRGFSLLELLVVLFVVVIITSLATLNVGSGNQDLRLEAQVRQLQNVALFALDEAQLSGRDMGLLLFLDTRGPQTTFGFDWRERRPEGWRKPVAASDVFHEQALPAEIDLGLLVENVPSTDLLSCAGGSGRRTAGCVLCQRRGGSRRAGAAPARQWRGSLAPAVGSAGAHDAAAAR